MEREHGTEAGKHEQGAEDETEKPKDIHESQQEQEALAKQQEPRAGQMERCEIYGMEEYSYRFRPRTMEIARALADYALTRDYDAYARVVNGD
jgi:hypothetical protein